MYVKWLKLNNFRNYENCVVDFSSGINLISGKNGQGKTNMVEAVMLNALSKSPRTSRDDDLKRENSDYTEAELCIQRSFGDVIVKCRMDNQNKKTFYINSNQVDKVSDIFGNLVAVYFSPNDLKIVTGSPSERRDFMDTDISQLSGSYYNLIQRYNKVLDQRNKLLKTVHIKSLIESQIHIWNEQLAGLAGHIIKTRKSFIKKLSVPANETIRFISKDLDSLNISYIGAKGETAEEIKNEILNSLEYNLDKDMELGYTTIGPHRDDIKFEINGHDSKIFASQGQQRTIVLSLKIAELSVFADEIGENPVLVLDDVFSELDSSRQRKLYSKFDNIQVLLTGTHFKYKPEKDYLQIVVNNGNVRTKMKYCKNTENN